MSLPESEPFLPLRPNGYVGAGRYLLQQHLGDGGMGSVWAAWDREVGKHYALKFLSLSAARDPEHWARLRQEILRAQELRNEHIVGIFDLVVVPGEAPFLKMEYVPGRNLEVKRLEFAEGAMPWDKIAPLIPQLCDALEHAHDRGVVHCDIKPSNLMVDGLGQLKLADFGIAQLSGTGETGPVFGTKAYMSPQRLMGTEPEPRDDIYAVGATLYELLTGEPPFVGDSLTSRIIEEPAEALHERLRRLGISHDVPIRAAQIIMRCLDKDPAARPQNARELGRILGPASGVPRSKPKPPPPPLAPPPPTPPSSRHRTPAAPEPRIPASSRPTPAAPTPAPIARPPAPAGDVRVPATSPASAPAPAPAPSATAEATGPSTVRSTAATSPDASTPPTAGTDDFPGSPAPESPTGNEDVATELWRVLLKIILIAGALTGGALGIPLLWWGQLNLQAVDRGLPENSRGATFSFHLLKGTRVVSRGTLTNGEILSLSLRPGEYLVSVARGTTHAETPASETPQTLTTTIRFRRETTLAFPFEPARAATPPEPTPGSVELTVSVASDATGRFDPARRWQFDYVIERAGARIHEGKAVRDDATTIVLAPGDYRVRVRPADAADVPFTESEKTANAQVTAGARSSVTIQYALRPPPAPPEPPAQVVVSTPPQRGQSWVRRSRQTPAPDAARFIWLPAPGGPVWLAAHETTVRAFTAYAADHPVDTGLYLPGVDGWRLDASRGWREPGFSQGPDHPVVGVSWNDAEAFCRWLTERDRAEGLLATNQSYRLPKATEFAYAARDLRPQAGAGNLAGDEVRGSGLWHERWPFFPGHGDPFAATAPVGSAPFSPSTDGLHDLIGNAAEWCADWFTVEANDPAVRRTVDLLRRPVAPQSAKIVMGGSWFNEAPEDADPQARFPFPPERRYPFIGFRLALEEGADAP